MFGSVQSRDGLGRRENLRDDSADISFQSSAGTHCDFFWLGQGCTLFDVVHPAFPLPSTASPLFPSCPEGWFWRGYRGVQHAEQCKFLSSCVDSPKDSTEGLAISSTRKATASTESSSAGRLKGIGGGSDQNQHAAEHCRPT